MQRLPVDSTDIVSIGYDPKSRVLEIEFKENRIYQYQDVEPDVHERFMRTDSFGQYFFAFISGHYRYARVDGEERPDGAVAAGALAFVSGNVRKLRNLKAACEPLGIAVEQLELPVEEIQSHDPEKIALAKAKAAYKLAGRPVLVCDDTWNILALKGFPGAFMSYVDEWFKVEDFLRLLQGASDRTAGWIQILVYYDGKRSKVFMSHVFGKVLEAPRGEGAPWVRLFALNGYDKTLAEFDAEPGGSDADLGVTMWAEFAKWYNLQRRLKRA